MSVAKNEQIILVCFAVKQEAAPFRKFVSQRKQIEILVTGMGQKNSETAFRKKIESIKPAIVFTCGFAGGLNPALKSGDVVFSADNFFRFSYALYSAKAIPVSFYLSPQIATTAEEKKALRHLTEADAVEMESQIIRTICAEQNIPSATVRVISDAADENLPLDFNKLMTPEYNLNFSKLLRTVLFSPTKIGGLMRLQRQTKKAADNLSAVLQEILRETI